MVVRTLWTPMRAAKQAKSQLKRIGTKILGCILNGVPHSRGYYPYYYGYYGYYAYRYSYDEEPRRKSSVRELGLKVESAIKEKIGSAQHTIPRYVASGTRFSWHILRRAVFWLLLALLIAITGIRLYLKSFQPPESEEEDYISYNYSAQAPESEAKRAIEVVGGDTEHSPQRAEGFGNAERSAETANALPGFAYRDSIELWAKAIESRDSARYALFYDPADFRFPQGGYNQWIALRLSKWLKDAPESGIIRVDTAWAEKQEGFYYKVKCEVSTGRKNASRRKLYTMIWKLGDNSWRIVREKVNEIK